MDKFRNKYRIQTCRAQWWDYSTNGVYFITVCCKDRACIFGEINENEMYLSELGEIVNQEWDKSFTIRKELFCDAFCIMPNHLHALLRIENYEIKTDKPSTSKAIAPRQAKSISTFVGAFKGAVTRRINEKNNTCGENIWQDLFYDNIVRNDTDYQRIVNYIQNQSRQLGE